MFPDKCQALNLESSEVTCHLYTLEHLSEREFVTDMCTGKLLLHCAKLLHLLSNENYDDSYPILCPHTLIFLNFAHDKHITAGN